MEDLRRQIKKLLPRVDDLEREIVELRAQNSELQARKSVIGTCRKNGRNFLEYGLSVVRARQSDSV